MVSLETVDGRIDLPERTKLVPLDFLEQISHQINPQIRADGIRASSSTDRFGPASESNSNGRRGLRLFVRDGLQVIEDKIHADSLFQNGLFKLPIEEAFFSLLKYVGTEDVPERGIYRGKQVHEIGYVADGFPRHWVSDPNELGVNPDSRDATPHTLIVMDKMLKILPDRPDLFERFLSYAVPMLEWDLKDSEEHGGFPTYTGAEFDKERKTEGLTNHRWTDCGYFVTNENGTIPKHPIAAVEIAAMTWAARLRWADRLEGREGFEELSRKLRISAGELQGKFMEHFVFEDEGGPFLADALDGDLKPVKSVTCNPIIALSYDYEGNQIVQDEDLVREIIERTFTFFDPRGGILTVDPKSYTHPKNIYQGKEALWIKVQSNAMRALLIASKRLRKLNPTLSGQYEKMAITLAQASLKPPHHFASPIEVVLLLPSGGYRRYEEYDEDGKKIGEACRVQSWTGSAMEYAISFLRSRGISNVDISIPNPSLSQVV